MDEQIKFIVNDENEELFHWSDRITILLVLRGKCIFEYQNQKSIMHEGDLWILNPFSLYQLERSEGSDVLKIIIPDDAGKQMKLYTGEEIFCRSDLQAESHKEALEEIRKLLAELFLLCIKKNEENTSDLLIQSYLYQILYCLKQGFIVNVPDKEIRSEEPLKRLRKILGRIHRGYGENLTLKQIAQEEYLSMNYLSRYFQQKTGVGFNQYLNRVRLLAAIRQLQDTNISITEIAGKCGFGDATQFTKKFHEKYGMSPRDYRRQKIVVNRVNDNIEIFNELLKYAENKNEKKNRITERVKEQNIVVNVENRGKRLQHSWKNLVNIGFAKDGLSAVIQNQLKIIQKEIGFRYIHFHGLLDDDMMIYSEDEDGTPIYNFKYMDMLFDFFLSIHLKPYVELSFMPSALAKPSKKLYAKTVYLSMPKNMVKWAELIHRLTVHCISRYGQEEVETWRFLPWTGPVGFSEYGQYTLEEYLNLYKRTWEVLKGIDPKLQVGGPSMESYYIWEESGYYNKFVEYTMEHGCFPDFITVDCYPTKINEKEDGESLVLIEKTEALSRVTSKDEKYVEHLLDYLDGYHKKINGHIPKIVFVEWNSSMWQRDLTNDTTFKASYMAKNILENYDRVGAFGYWEMSDYIEEVIPGTEEFHGGFGLFTYQSIRKSGYYCLEFLAKLGDRLIGKGEGYFITKKNEEIQIILYNYVHFNKLYRYRHANGVDRVHRNGAFLNGESIQYRLGIEGFLECEQIKIREYEISERGGSAYDLWKNAGAPEILSVDEIKYFQRGSIPFYHCWNRKWEERIEVDFLLKPNSVKLIILNKVDS